VVYKAVHGSHSLDDLPVSASGGLYRKAGDDEKLIMIMDKAPAPRVTIIYLNS
jgi:hypothetical protein